MRNIVYMQAEEFLSVHKVKNWGRWASSIAPSGRSSLMKYLIMKNIGNMLGYYHPYQSGA
jgi:hypothetical protein